MSQDYLRNMHFQTTNGDTITSEEFVDLMHDPDILYYSIKESYERIDQDLEIDADGKDAGVELHAHVEIFQSTMQLVEAFGIYFLAYLKGREELLEDLIKTDPRDLKEFFERLQKDEVQEYLDDQGIAGEYRTLLETVFGYAFVDQVERTDSDEPVTEAEFEEAIEQSVNVLDAQIRRVGEFYRYFDRIYNAVKHGNRVIPEIQHTVNITGADTNIELDLDMGFILFVCKNRDGTPYIAAVPVTYLVDLAIDIADTVHHVFSHLKRVSVAAIKEEPFDASFFKLEESADDAAEPQWAMALHSSGIIILPRTPEIEDLQQTIEWTFAGRFEINHQTMRIRTQRDDDISPAYPIKFQLRQKGTLGLTPNPIIGLNLNFTVKDLDIVQYLEFLRLQDILATNGDQIRLAIVDETTDTEFPPATPENLDISLELEEFLDRERLEQLYWLQKINGRRIPIPLDISDQQKAVIDQCVASDLTEQAAHDAVTDLEKLGSNRVFTEIYADKISPIGEIVESTLIDIGPGRISFHIEHQDTDQTGEATKIGLPTHYSIDRYDRLVEELQTTEGIIDDILDEVVLDGKKAIETVREGQSQLFVQSERGDPGFWFTKDTFRVQFIEHPQDRLADPNG